MNSLPVTQIFTQAHTYRTPSSREAERQAIAAASAAYSGPIQMLPGYEPKPRPARKSDIDPDTVLARKRYQRIIDHEIFSAIRENIDSSGAAIAKMLKHRGLKVTAYDVNLVAERRGIELKRTWK